MLSALRTRRVLAASGLLTESHRVKFTQGELAALSIVAIEHHFSGCCVMSSEDIGSRAGCSASTAAKALRLAARHRLIKSRPKIAGRGDHPIAISSGSWRQWLKRAEVQSGLIETVAYLSTAE
jgi:hypothetical protein